MKRLERLKPFFIGAAVVFLAACLPGFLKKDPAVLHGYLMGLTFWSGISLGSLGLLMVNHTTGGRWGVLIRRPLEAAAGTIPVCAALFLPVLYGAGHLYEWAHAVDDKHIAKISAYLNLPFFMFRFVVYFAVWTWLATSLRRLSLRQDAGEDVSSKLRSVSAPGIVMFVLTTTLAFTDWMMSLEPHWYSTIYGLMVLVGHTAAAMAFAIVVSFVLREEAAVKPVANPNRFHQLGNLQLAFVMLWTYLAFSQFLLIWSANLAEEVPWIIRRTTGGWQWLAVGLAVFHFAAPFFTLLSRQAKRRANALAGVAGFLLVARWFDILWLIGPAMRDGGFSIHWADIASTLGVGGVWLWCFTANIASRRLAPVGDPLFAEASR